MKQMTTKETWKSNLIMTTWNVRTWLIPGKMQEISKEMMKCKIDIVALQEIRRRGKPCLRWMDDGAADSKVMKIK